MCTNQRFYKLEIIGADSSKKQFKFDHIFRPEDNQGTAEKLGELTTEPLHTSTEFRVSKRKSDTMRYELSVSILEIYNEEIRDLLDNKAKQPANKRTNLEDPGLTSGRVVLETWLTVLERCSESGSRARSVGSTNANEFSSRSHCIGVVYLIASDCCWEQLGEWTRDEEPPLACGLGWK
ncbi:kinesin-like protein KIN-14S [Tanacetum coccineum]|uniref:Kinesin-like protein KIN-14S n=1 Tax=Tanacetum coccineum TaxID=301880 RepID=A0ABQ5AIT6_9ASTR